MNKIDPLYTSLQALQEDIVQPIERLESTLPTFELPNLPSWLEQHWDNSLPGSSGTILNADGSPQAVIFTINQYDNIIDSVDYIKKIMSLLTQSVAQKIQLRDKAIQLLSSVSAPSQKALMLNPIQAIVLLILGVWWIKKIENRLTQEKKSAQTWDYLPPIIIAIGVVLLVGAMLDFNLIDYNCPPLIARVHKL